MPAWNWLASWFNDMHQTQMVVNNFNCIKQIQLLDFQYCERLTGTGASWRCYCWSWTWELPNQNVIIAKARIRETHLIGLFTTLVQASTT